MAIESEAFKRALGRFATGVTVVTTVDRAGAPQGLTVNSFTSVSLDPPLVLFCLDRAAGCFDVFAEASHFAVNILALDQSALSDRFASLVGDRFNGAAFRVGATGCPVIAGALAAMECEIAQRHDGGDHEILVGRVLTIDDEVRGDGDAAAAPLLYYRGGYARLDG